MAEAVDIGIVSRSFRSALDETAGQFKRAANENSANLTKIVKDIGSMFKAQRGDITELTNAVEESVSESQQVANKIDSQTTIFREILSFQSEMAGYLKTISANIKFLNDNTVALTNSITGSGVNSLSNVLSGSLTNSLKLLGFGTVAGVGIGAAVNTLGGGKGVGESGSSSEAMSFFQSKGWSKEQAAGIVGNLQVESTNFSTAVLSGQKTGDGGKAVGVAQWHPPRQANFQRIMGKPVAGSSFKEQLEFVQWELNNTHKRAGDALKQATSAAAAADIIRRLYEAPSKDPVMGAHQQRITNAINLAGQSQTTPQSAPGGAAAPAATPVAPTPAAQPSVNAPGTLPNAPGVGTPPANMSQRRRTPEGQRSPPAATPAPTAATPAPTAATPAPTAATPAPTAQSGQESKPEAQTPAGGTTQDAVAFLQSRQGGGSGFTGVNASKLNPTFAQKLMAAIQAAEQATGDKIVITEGYRDPAVQAQYYANYIQRPVTWEGKTYTPKKPGGLAAPPGRSNHQKGMAVDISEGRAREWLRANVGRFGLKQLGQKDKPHFELAGASLGGEYAPENTNQQAPGTGQGTAPGAGSVGAPSPGMGGMGGLSGMGAMGMRMPFGFGGMLGGMMGGGRMGAFGALAGMALGGLGAALGSAAAAPSMPSGPTPSTPALQAPQTGKGFVSPFAGIDSDNPAQFFAADKQLQSMIQNKQIQTAALESEANRQKPPTVNVTQPQQPADQQKTLLDQQGRSDMYTVVALWEKDIFKWLGIKEESNFG